MNKEQIERLKQFIAAEGITIGTFEKRAGLANATISNLGLRTRQSTIQRIAAAYPQLNMNWVMTGRGGMNTLFPNDTPVIIQSEYNEEDCQQKSVPVVPTSELAKPLKDFIPYDGCERMPALVENVDFAITMNGNELFPLIKKGARLLVRKIDHNAFIEYNKVYVLDTKNGILCRIIRESQSENFIRCATNDITMPPVDVPKAAVFGIYKVVMDINMH